MHDHFSNHHEHTHHHHYTHPWPFLKELEKLGDEYLVRKAPWQFPHTWKTAVAKILPVIVLIVAILSIPGILGGLLMLLGFGGWGKSYIMILIQTAILIIIAALYFRSFDRLRKKQYSGWVYVFYAGLIGLVSHLLEGNILGAIVGFVIGMYIIFQVKEMYR